MSKGFFNGYITPLVYGNCTDNQAGACGWHDEIQNDTPTIDFFF